MIRRAWRLAQGRVDRRLRRHPLGMGAEREQVRHGLDHDIRQLADEQAGHRRSLEVDGNIAQRPPLVGGANEQLPGRGHRPRPRKARRPEVALAGGASGAAMGSACSAWLTANAVSRACSCVGNSKAGENSEQR
ncbi:hypothetical protein SDC9_151676 [bioreactor metagenome]|uniref:Uncharacterized protein n=1 Tax=bioreactor metagenome TaxID=1076179 RepID=A0A645EQY2_9ZZZZ